MMLNYYQTLNVNMNATAGEPISSTNGTADGGYKIHLLIISKDAALICIYITSLVIR